MISAFPRNLLIFSVAALALGCLRGVAATEISMINVPGREAISLNGKWNVIIDPADAGAGSWAAIYKDRQVQGKTDFVEYSFENGPVLDVPGDFNSQSPELNFFESSVWYKKVISFSPKPNTRTFLHFGAVNYKSDVYLNGEYLGSHEGGFTPFQFEVTGKLKTGENGLIVRANNKRFPNGIPAVGYDWHNYGGITRDVTLIQTPDTFVRDYFIQLEKGSARNVAGWLRLDGPRREQTVHLRIPEAGINQTVRTDGDGFVRFSFPATLELWSPANPKLYQVEVAAETDRVEERIGFRTIEVKGKDILLNGKSIFLKGVSIHEENPMRRARAYSESDALVLLTWAKELGCNFVRLAHYPQNEHTVRLAEQMGFLLWEEVPVYQGIDFADPKMQDKMEGMLREMIQRDKNRCAIALWSLSNETSPGPDRNASLTKMANLSRSLDPTRLVASAFNHWRTEGAVMTIDDPLSEALDVVSINEYIGWYKPWPNGPSKVEWRMSFDKPLLISEFGAEALYGNHGPSDVASSWSEEYQEQFYKDQVAMFPTMPDLRGVCPWILVDFRSPGRMHPKYQNGWNRKGLLSDRGEKKKAWYIMKSYYDSIK